MDEPRLYDICVEGHLPDRWSHWFAGLTIHNEPDGHTKLNGCLVDQAALFGVLARLHALNLTLISVNRAASERLHRQETARNEPPA